MKILFHLGHPAHFHLFKHTIEKLIQKKYEIHILIKTKDVLEGLLINSGFEYTNILPNNRYSGKKRRLRDLFLRGKFIRAYCKDYKPDFLIGTSADISYTGKLLGIPAINVIEDDAANILSYALLSYPFATALWSPRCNNNLFWNYKTTFYSGYHELAYLHPNYFTADATIADQYVETKSPYFLIRLTAFKAYDDARKQGINNKYAVRLVNLLKERGQVWISSERELPPALEQYRLSINPADIHHILAHASLFISDSQTMSAEAAVLGVPNIRFSDDVGKLGYLEELEHTYKLSRGIKPQNPNAFFQLVEDSVSQLKKLKKLYQKRREKMLKEKIDVTEFFVKSIIKQQEHFSK